MASKRIKKKIYRRKFRQEYQQGAEYAKKDIIKALLIGNGGTLIAAEKEASKINDYVFSLVFGHTEVEFISYNGLRRHMSTRVYHIDLRRKSVKQYKTRLKEVIWCWLSGIIVKYGVKDGLYDYDNVRGLTEEWKTCGINGIQVRGRKTIEELPTLHTFVKYMRDMIKNCTESEVE